MKPVLQKLYSFINIILGLLCLLLSAFWLGSAFFKTGYSLDMDSQIVLFKTDNPLINLICTAGALFAFYMGAKVIRRHGRKTEKLLFWLVLGITGILGLTLILFGRTMPAADAMSVYAIGESFAAGDFSAIEPTNSYLSYYPQQLGLALFYVPFIRLWKLLPTSLSAYHFIKCIYVALVWVIIIFQAKTVRLLFEEARAYCLYLFLACLNLPLIFYSSFVYGEIPSFAAVSIGFYYLLVFLRRVSSKDMGKVTWISFGLSILTLSLGVLLRKNTLILIIAVVLMVLCQYLRQPRAYILLLYTALCIAFSLGISPGVQKIMEAKAGNTLRSGVTATSYFAMGMQEASRGKGWYNGFNFYTYQDTGMDTEKTNAIAKEAISERLAYFKEHPDYAKAFYREKYLSQWTDGTYACRQATMASAGGRKGFMNSVYEGKVSWVLLWFCNQYQNVLYLGVFGFCLFNLFGMNTKKGHPLGVAVYLGLVGVLGGFFFHMLWEANSRYIFLYSLLMLPYSAAGLSKLFSTVKMRDRQ